MFTRYALLLLPLFAACAPLNETSPPSPSLGFFTPYFYGPDIASVQEGVGPSGSITWSGSWTGTCVHHQLFDGDSSSSCDEQSFRIRVSCEGVPCTADPPEALTEQGASYHGYGGVQVHPTVAGELSMTASIERKDTHEKVTSTGVVTVVEPDALRIVCRYEADGQWPGVECPSDTPFVAGSAFVMWVVATKDDQPITITPVLAFEGWQPVDDGLSYDEPILRPTAAGAYALHASYGALSADYEVTLR